MQDLTLGPRICIEVFDEEYEFSLTRWKVPVKGYLLRNLPQQPHAMSQ